MGFIMNLLEGTYESYLENRKRKLSFQELINRRIQICNENLFIDDIRQVEEEIPQLSSRVMNNSVFVINSTQEYFDNAK